MVEGCTTAGIGCADCKNHLLERMLPRIEPVSIRRKELEQDPGRVKEVLQEGSTQARSIARQTMDEVRQAMKIKY